ncbi:MAG: hypothetical protein M0C28_13945 [Candidatus Moduliflexus flocculans]|nr:hypothetical protein [Candidatus Moduliflexus flocculans]
MPERDRSSRCAVEYAQSVRNRAQPEPACGILRNGRDRLAGEIVRPVPVSVEPGEVRPVGIETVEAAVLRPDPESPLAVFEKGPDAVAAEAAGIAGAWIRKWTGLAGRGIDPEQAVVERADPDRAVPVGENIPIRPRRSGPRGIRRGEPVAGSSRRRPRARVPIQRRPCRSSWTAITMSSDKPSGTSGVGRRPTNSPVSRENLKSPRPVVPIQIAPDREIVTGIDSAVLDGRGPAPPGRRKSLNR